MSELRELLQLAKNYTNHQIGGWFVSDKLDGMRAYWDGGTTRGMLAADVPWANCEKDGRLKEQPVSTGLWTRYGKVIHAPDYWLNKLPDTPLDGELYLGLGQFQELMSICKQYNPGKGWENVKYYVFDSPPWHAFLKPGRINNPNFKKIIPPGLDSKYSSKIYGAFRAVNMALRDIEWNDTVLLHVQTRLSEDLRVATSQVSEMLAQVSFSGGEGLMLRNPFSFWEPKRNTNLLKVKKLLDAEARVVGYTWGREGKLIGLMGALIVEYSGKVFELSGFTDAERQLTVSETDKPGKIVNPEINNTLFPRGSIISFKYRELTNDGIPKEARFWRK